MHRGWSKVTLPTALLTRLESNRGVLPELKAFIKRNWHLYADLPQQDFQVFLESVWAEIGSVLDVNQRSIYIYYSLIFIIKGGR